jgi:hypothetical protein
MHRQSPRMARRCRSGCRWRVLLLPQGLLVVLVVLVVAGVHYVDHRRGRSSSVQSARQHLPIARSKYTTVNGRAIGRLRPGDDGATAVGQRPGRMGTITWR